MGLPQGQGLKRPWLLGRPVCREPAASLPTRSPASPHVCGSQLLAPQALPGTRLSASVLLCMSAHVCFRALRTLPLALLACCLFPQVPVAAGAPSARTWRFLFLHLSLSLCISLWGPGLCTDLGVYASSEEVRPGPTLRHREGGQAFHRRCHPRQP